jgi:hypothetical protein
VSDEVGRGTPRTPSRRVNHGTVLLDRLIDRNPND